MVRHGVSKHWLDLHALGTQHLGRSSEHINTENMHFFKVLIKVAARNRLGRLGSWFRNRHNFTPVRRRLHSLQRIRSWAGTLRYRWFLGWCLWRCTCSSVRCAFERIIFSLRRCPPSTQSPVEPCTARIPTRRQMMNSNRHFTKYCAWPWNRYTCLLRRRRLSETSGALGKEQAEERSVP